MVFFSCEILFLQKLKDGWQRHLIKRLKLWKKVRKSRVTRQHPNDKQSLAVRFLKYVTSINLISQSLFNKLINFASYDQNVSDVERLKIFIYSLSRLSKPFQLFLNWQTCPSIRSLSHFMENWIKQKKFHYFNYIK